MPGDLNQTCLTSKKWAEKCDSFGPDELVTFFAGLQRNPWAEALQRKPNNFPSARLSEHRTVMAERLLQAAASGRLSAVQRWMDEVMVRAGICDPKKSKR